jgi:hypothetical protein
MLECFLVKNKNKIKFHNEKLTIISSFWNVESQNLQKRK